LFSIQNVIPTDSDTTDETMMTYKMLFIVNGSLSMSSGKMATQVAHAAVDLYQQIQTRRMQALGFWNVSGQRKIVVRGNSTEELLDIEQQASGNRSIVTAIIRDAGLTEIPSGSITCLGLFGTNNQLDPITRHFKLMNDCLKCSGGNIQQQKSRKNKNDTERPQSTTTNPDDISNT
jgi:PTH2 family peptidyl-tRNA hydrolase